MSLTNNLSVLEVKSDRRAHQLSIDSFKFFWWYWRIRELFVTIFVVGRTYNRCKVKFCISWIQKLVIKEPFSSSSGFFRFILNKHKIGLHGENTAFIGRCFEFEVNCFISFELDVDRIDQKISIHLLLMLELFLGKLLIISCVANS